MHEVVKAEYDWKTAIKWEKVVTLQAITLFCRHTVSLFPVPLAFPHNRQALVKGHWRIQGGANEAMASPKR